LIQGGSEHGSTFLELERRAGEEDPDIDRINLLLDLIQVVAT
jgi:hypothetical protein